MFEIQIQDFVFLRQNHSVARYKIFLGSFK